MMNSAVRWEYVLALAGGTRSDRRTLDGPRALHTGKHYRSLDMIETVKEEGDHIILKVKVGNKALALI